MNMVVFRWSTDSFFLMPRQVKITSLSSQNEAYSQKNGLLCCRVTEETDVSGCWRHTVFIKVNVPNNSLIFHLFQWTSVCLYVPGVRYDGQKPEGRSNLIVQLSAEWWGEPPPGSHTHSQQHNELKQTHTFLFFLNAAPSLKERNAFLPMILFFFTWHVLFLK